MQMQIWAKKSIREKHSKLDYLIDGKEILVINGQKKETKHVKLTT